MIKTDANLESCDPKKILNLVYDRNEKIKRISLLLKIFWRCLL